MIDVRRSIRVRDSLWNHPCERCVAAVTSPLCSGLNNGYVWTGAIVEHNNRLYIGTTNRANGGEVWLFLHNRVYLPLIRR